MTAVDVWSSNATPPDVTRDAFEHECILIKADAETHGFRSPARQQGDEWIVSREVWSLWRRRRKLEARLDPPRPAN